MKITNFIEIVFNGAGSFNYAKYSSPSGDVICPDCKKIWWILSFKILVN